MREVIKTAKTVEEATELALAELGVSAEDAEIEVLELPQRRLFRSIPAKVRVYLEEAQAQAEPEAKPSSARRSAETPRQETPKKKRPQPEQPQPEQPQLEQPQPEQTKQPAPQKEQTKQPEAAAPKRPAPDAAAKNGETQKPAQTAQAAAEVPEEPIDLSTDQKARDAVEYLSAVCAQMGASALTVTPVRQGEAVILRIEGEGAGALIGHRGEVMEALSYLTSLVANRSGGDYMKISLDINHYRSKREANLTALARRIGAKVARTGRGHTLEPMNPYERRIIHSAISEMEGVKSESIGEGANRRVVISCTNPNVRPPRERDRDSRGGRGGRPGRSGGGQRGGREGGRGPRRDGERGPRTSTPPREFADRPRDPNAAPTVPQRTETINDGADLPLYGKIEL